MLLVLALSAFVLDRLRYVQRPRDDFDESCCWRSLPTLLVMAQPDLGTGIVYVTIALALLFVAGTKWTHFAALGGARGRGGGARAGGRAGGRARRC